MNAWLLTLHGPSGPLGSVETGETQFVVGSETASDVYTVSGSGVAGRHAWVWVSPSGLHVEDLAGGTLVNGYAITEKVRVSYPAAVQMGEITLLFEVITQTPVENTAPAPGEIAAATPAGKAVELGKAHVNSEYTLIQQIARGGMGQIHLGDDPQLDRQVAIKISTLADGGKDPRFEKEARVLARLAHPNIVPIHATGSDAQGRPFYSMKLIKGRTLQAILHAIRDGEAQVVRDYPSATLLTIFRKICDALAFAHSKKILHRDLKPENIMVGEYGEVLVMDWGLAKLLGETEDRSGAECAQDTGDYGMTLEGEVMGTPQYMSPEQAAGTVADLDARSDIYSLGGILYALLTLRPPVEGKTLNEVLTKVKNGEISSMLTRPPGTSPAAPNAPAPMGRQIPDALRAVTLKAMATDRNKRYASVEEFAADIDAYQNGFATRAEAAGAFRQLVLFVRRNKGVAAAAVLFLLSAAGFTIRLAASEKIARTSESQAREEMEKSRRSEAEAQIILADSAYSIGNAEQMRAALQRVPEDLRNQVCRYLEKNTAGGDVGVPAEGESSWLGLEPNPLEPGSFFAIKSDGAFCNIAGATGDVKVLWRAPSPPLLPGQLSVSKDGSVIALHTKPDNSKNTSEIQIRNVKDGTLLRTLEVPPDRFMHGRLWVSPSHLVAQLANGQKKEYDLAVWSIADGTVLSTIPQKNTSTFVAPINDSTDLLIFNSLGILQRIQPGPDKVLVQSKNSLGRRAGSPEAIDGSPDWKKFAMTTGSTQRVRVFSDAWSDKLQTDFVSRSTVVALSFLPDTDLLLAMCRVSEQALCLEVRDCSQGGRLVRSFPFSNPKFRGDFMYGLRCSGTFAAFLMANKIRIWNLTETPPQRYINHLEGIPVSGWSLSPNGRQALSFRKSAQGSQAQVEEIYLHDLTPDSPKETGKIDLTPQGAQSGPALRGGLADQSLMIEFDRTGTRALMKHHFLGLALQIESGTLKSLWGQPKRLLTKAASGQRMLIHPTADLLWTGDSIVRFSTGEEVRRIKRGTVARHGACYQSRIEWLGERHVVEQCPITSSEEGESDEFESNRLVLWDTQTGESVAEELSPFGVCLAVSPDGSGLAEGCSDYRVRFRNPRTLAVEREFRVHDSGVKSIAWHPSLPILATLGVNEVRFWDVNSGRMLDEIRLRREAYALRFVSQGRQLLVGGALFEPKCCAP